MAQDLSQRGKRNEAAQSRQATALRRGWTTGACATAATKAALAAILTGEFEDPVTIVLPKGEQPSFALAREGHEGGVAFAAIVKDAGDDPDVTHGATVEARVRLLPPGSGVVFRAGPGVGTVTRPGLPLAVGEPAINPVPRVMMMQVVTAMLAAHSRPADVEITVSIDNGAELAEKTWNPRLGIVGGLSVLGTTGVVHPFSCSAWIHSIHRGIDVARAAGEPHVVAATGSASEDAALRHHPVPAHAVIDMGDFAGAVLKYLRHNPVPGLTLAGGFAKMVKLAQGALDLHSGRSQVDLAFLAECVQTAFLRCGRSPDPIVTEQIAAANSALEALEICQAKDIPVAAEVAARAWATASATLRGADVSLETMVCDRDGAVLAIHRHDNA